MATRCYFPHTTAAPVTAPNPSGTDWEHIQDSPGGRQRKLLFRVASATTLTTEAYAPDGADDLTNRDAYHRTYVSDPIAAQTTGGNIKGQFQCLETLANDNLFLTLKAYVVSNNGVTVRSPNLLSITRDTTTELGTSIANRNFPSTALGAVTCTEGDRIVIEVGLGGSISSGTGGTVGHNGSIRWGDNASSGDLPEDDTQTGATYRAWVEFSQTIKTLGDSDGSATGAATVDAPGVALWDAVAAATGAGTAATFAAWVLAALASASPAASADTPAAQIAAAVGDATGAAEADAAGEGVAPSGPTTIEADAAAVGAATADSASAAIWDVTAAGTGAASADAVPLIVWATSAAALSAAVADAETFAVTILMADGAAGGLASADAVSGATKSAVALALGVATTSAAGDNAAAPVVAPVASGIDRNRRRAHWTQCRP